MCRLTNRPHRIACIALVGVFLAVAAIGQTSDSSYRIGPRDLIAIRVFEEPALNGQYRVSENGTVRLPLIGEFPVRGLTEAQLTENLKQHLESSYLQRASVTVEVREFLSRPISVIGAVENPGNLDLSGRYTLLQALTAAGGVTAEHGNMVYVRRRAPNGLTAQLALPLDRLMLGNDPRLDIPIFADDVINVSQSTTLTVYLLGEVETQGALEFDSSQNVTLLTAISRAGGITERAADKLTIRRTLRDGSIREIAIDYKRVINGRDPDPTLQDGDVIVIKESFF